MPETHESGTRVSKAWNWHPELPIGNSPLFLWPPEPVDTMRWFAGSWLKLSMTAVILALSVVVWVAFQPAMEQFRNFEAGWVAQIVLRNLVLVTVLAGGSHLYLHRAKLQGDRHKFMKREFAENNRAFTLNNQVRDNMFWTLLSGVPVWSGYEALYMWAMANGHIPMLPENFTWTWMAVLIFLTPLWLSFHFYWVHRMLHWPPLYRRVHSLHHRNIHVGPWSGLAMHPVEHCCYFSSILIHLIVPSHPLIMYFHMYLQALNPIASHSGFDDLLAGNRRVISLGEFFHQLHHRYFECNYGTADVPWDKWFGSFHDGSDQATSETRARTKYRPGRRGHYCAPPPTEPSVRN